MADEEQLAILKQGVEVWNAWRKEHSGITPDLSGADLHKFVLPMVNLSVTNLSGANLYRTNFAGADLSGASLFNANLRRAGLFWTDLVGADLAEANLTKANLNLANLRGARLSGACLFEVDLVETILADLDLSCCKGLDSCVHRGPSTIDHRTLQRSGRLPLVFLRGIGLPDSLIKQLPRLVGPAQFHDCFISYSSQDRKFVGQLYNDLREGGVLCWYAPEDMKAGGRILDTVHKAIGEHQKVLLILSAASIASEWVEREVKRALAEERSSGRDILVPICIDDAIFTTGEAWAVTLHDDRHIADFRPKTPDAYRKNLDQLLDNLKVEAADDDQPPAG